MVHVTERRYRIAFESELLDPSDLPAVGDAVEAVPFDARITEVTEITPPDPVPKQHCRALNTMDYPCLLDEGHGGMHETPVSRTRDELSRAYAALRAILNSVRGGFVSGDTIRAIGKDFGVPL